MSILILSSDFEVGQDLLDGGRKDYDICNVGLDGFSDNLI